MLRLPSPALPPLPDRMSLVTVLVMRNVTRIARNIHIMGCREDPAPTVIFAPEADGEGIGRTQAGDRGRKDRCLPARGRGSDRDQIAHEDEGLARRDLVPGAPVSVGQIRRDDQLTAAADPHALHALIPAGDDVPGTELELQRIASVPAGVEFLPRRVRDADIVNLDPVARARHAAVSFPDVGDQQLGRRFAAGKVDLWFGDAHARPLPVARRSGLIAPWERGGSAEPPRSGSWQPRWAGQRG